MQRERLSQYVLDFSFLSIHTLTYRIPTSYSYIYIWLNYKSVLKVHLTICIITCISHDYQTPFSHAMDIIHAMHYSYNHAHETLTKKPTWPPRLPLLCMHAYIMKDTPHSTECRAFKQSLHSSCLNLQRDDFPMHHNSSNSQSSMQIYIYAQIANTST